MPRISELTDGGGASLGDQAAVVRSAASRRARVNFARLTNIAAMTALTGMSDNDTVEVLGYSSEGDGGGGTFFWDAASTATADSGTIFAADAGGTGRWFRVYDGALNVRWFGAVGNGIADDLAAINACISASNTNYFSGKPYAIRWPNASGNTGRYMVSDTITVARNGHHWFGDSPVRRSQPVSIALLASAAPTVLLNYTGEAPSFSNLSFEGFSSGDKATTLIELHPNPRFPFASEISELGLDASTLYNFEDVDAEFNNCNFQHGTTAIKTYGRGLYVDACEFFSVTVGVDLDRETEFQNFDQAGTETDTGMRVYCIRSNRFHGMGTGSTCVLNVGTHKNVIGGLEFSGNLIDTTAAIMIGPMRNARFDCTHTGLEDIVFDAHSTGLSLGNAAGTYNNVSIGGSYNSYTFRNTRSGTQTTLDENESTSSTIINVVSTTGFTSGDIVLVQLDNGQTHRTTVASVSAGVSITVDDALPSAASSGNVVWRVIERAADYFMYADGASNLTVNATIRDVKRDVFRIDGDAGCVSINGTFNNVMIDGASAQWALLKMNGGDFQAIKVAGTVLTPSGLTSSPSIVTGVGAFTLVDYDFSGIAFDRSEFSAFSSAASQSPFGASDATPSVMGRTFVETGSSAVTITDFDEGYPGQIITVLSRGAITFDVTGTSLNGGTTDLVTASGDITQWHTENGSNWRLVAFMDNSADNSGGA